MNKGLRYLCFIYVSLLATQVFAQGLSGWSDKTVCRLVKSQPNNSEYNNEAERRKLNCSTNSASIKKSSSKSENPLDKLTIPKDWQLIKNQTAFDNERLEHIAEFNHNRRYPPYCYDLLKDWQQNVVKPSNFSNSRNFHSCLEQLSSYGYLRHFPSDPFVPQVIQDLYLHLGKTNGLKPHRDNHHPNFANHSYVTGMALGSFGGYYSIYYDKFDYNKEEREVVESMFINNMLRIKPRHLLPSGQQMCNPNSANATANGLTTGKMNSNTCGSILWALSQGQLLLGLKLGNEELFKKGIATTKWMLRFFDQKGLFVPYVSGKGGHALDYLDTVPRYLGVYTEIFATLDYDFLEHRINNGLRIKDLYDGMVRAFSDHQILVRSVASEQGKYGGFGWTVAQLRSWTSEEAMAKASYSWVLFARQSARYVDRYRPDLQKYRIKDFRNYGENGQGLDVVTPHSSIDPYMLYEANYLAEIGAELSGRKQNLNEIALKQERSSNYEVIGTTELSYKNYNSKSRKKYTGSSYVHAKKRPVPEHVAERLEDFTELVTGDRSYKRASYGTRFTATEFNNKSFRFEWYLINAGPSGGDARLLMTDKLIIKEGVATLIATPSHNLPSLELREQLTISLGRDILKLQGDLNVGDSVLSYPTEIQGSLNSRFGFGVWEHGDILAFKLIEE